MIKQIKRNIWQLHFKAFGSCVYLVKLKNKNILIDTSSKETRLELLNDLKKIKITPKEIDCIILTHNHYDHNGNIGLFPNAKIYTKHNFKELKFPYLKIIETPGHTKDSICILYKDILFSGDTIFDKDHNYIGRTDLPESSPKKMKKSLNLLKKIPYKVLCPGHVVQKKIHILKTSSVIKNIYEIEQKLKEANILNGLVKESEIFSVMKKLEELGIVKKHTYNLPLVYEQNFYSKE